MFLLQILVVLLHVGQYSVKCLPLDLETLTQSEKVAIVKLRKLMENELTAEYMKEDAYLIKWLSDKDFQVEDAAVFLRDNLIWRQEQRIDTILDENWEEIEIDFFYERSTKDMQGRPILYFYFGQWNIHKLMTEEDSLVTLGRYMVKILEESEQHVRKERKQKGGDSLSPTQFTLIINFDGYDIWNQGCFQCLHFYRGFCQTIESHFPRSIERATLINVPKAFEVVSWYIRAPLGEKAIQSVQLYGHNRRVWQSAILSYVNKNQVPGYLIEQPLTPVGDEYITTRISQNNTFIGN